MFDLIGSGGGRKSQGGREAHSCKDARCSIGEMHTENLGASQLIRAAVVAQLAKPAVEPSAPALLIKGVRSVRWVLEGLSLSLIERAR